MRALTQTMKVGIPGPEGSVAKLQWSHTNQAMTELAVAIGGIELLERAGRHQEAEAQLAAGDMEGALARLREANALDPGNTRAHRRLGELLLSKGERREAIEAFRALARNAPYDFGAWRLLASAQFAEGLYDDAVESYRRVLNLNAPGARPDPNDLIGLADSLRLAGRAEEARAAYEQLLAYAPADLAAVARQHLSELAPAQATPTPAHTPRPGEPTPTPQGQEIVSVSATPAPPPTPQPLRRRRRRGRGGRPRTARGFARRR
jgi:tetratricopeptide (TPR) repeat protein